MGDRTCGTCRAWKTTDISSGGRCCLHPPQLFMVPRENVAALVPEQWTPWTEASDGCFDHISKVTEFPDDV